MQKRKTIFGTVASFLLLVGVLFAAVIQDATVPANLLKINSKKSAYIVTGDSDRATYTLSSTFICTAAANIATIESSASQGFRLLEICINPGQQTTSATRLFTLTRRTAASTAGTLATAEGTAVPAISKRDPADGNYPGIARAASAAAITGGTLGAIVDNFVVVAPTVGSATVSNTQVPHCQRYGEIGIGKPIIVASGVANGINLADSAAAGCAGAGLSITVTVE